MDPSPVNRPFVSPVRKAPDVPLAPAISVTHTGVGTPMWQHVAAPGSLAEANLADHAVHMKAETPDSAPSAPLGMPETVPLTKRRRVPAVRERDWSNWEVVTLLDFRHHFDERIEVWKGQQGCRWPDKLHSLRCQAAEEEVKKGTPGALPWKGTWTA